jgi:hypothetical protein
VLSTTAPACSPTAAAGAPPARAKTGVYGIADQDAEAIGILGTSGPGVGVVGSSSGSGVGIRGTSTSGYGGLFEGGRTQLELVPMATAGKPTSGAHTKGEVYMDSNGSLFVCVATGTSGSWRKITSTPV